MHYLWKAKQVWVGVRRENTCPPERKGFAEKSAAGIGDSSKATDSKRLLATPSPGNRRLCGRSPYLFGGDHGNHVCSLLPHHLPEVVACVWQGPLGGYVVPFCPTDHHLETKESTGEWTPNPGRNFLPTMGPFLSIWKPFRPNGVVPLSKTLRPQRASNTVSRENAIKIYLIFFFFLSATCSNYVQNRDIKNIYIHVDIHT